MDLSTSRKNRHSTHNLANDIGSHQVTLLEDSNVQRCTIYMFISSLYVHNITAHDPYFKTYSKEIMNCSQKEFACYCYLKELK